MNDFSYPSMSKVGGILYPETSTFSRPNPINKSNSFSQSQEYDQWKSNSLPTSVSMTFPTNTNINTSINNNNNNNNTNMNNSSNSNPAINPVSCDLQDVIIYYQSQPELLRLILLSKVEEDKRRAEEAKLRAKELDMFLLQQQQQMTNGTPQTPDASIMSSTPPSIITNHSSNNMLSSCTTATSTPTTTNTATNNLLNTNQFGQIPRRPSALEILMDDSDCNRRDSALGSSFDGSANSDELEDRTFSPNSTSAATASMLSMSFTAEPMMSARNSLHPLSPPHTLNNNNQQIDETFSSQIKSNTSSVDPPRRYDSYFPQRPRRRREMQAISKIVETRDYPYVDGFFWKNNGNTIQKKTGNKSVYYKCSNSSKGCPVNKTVTWKENGEYLIKYRGEHLAECGKVQRIVDM